MTRPSAVARPILTPAQRRIGAMRRALAARGFNEAVHFSFIARNAAALFGGGDDARQLENPISADLDAMRPSVLPAAARLGARRARRAGSPHAMMFEIGPQFLSGTPGAQSDVAAGIRAGEPPRHWTKSAHAAPIGLPPRPMRSRRSKPPGAKSVRRCRPPRRPGITRDAPGRLRLDRSPSRISASSIPRVIAAFDLKGPVAGFEIFLDAIPEAKSRGGKARAKLDISDLMPVERDFAFVVDAKVAAQDVVKAARGADRQLIERVDVFDVYEGKGVPDGKKSLAIAVKLQPKERTLTDAEIEAVAQKIVTAVTKATGGTLRT